MKRFKRLGETRVADTQNNKTLFPIIENIDDVLPAMTGCDEFIVSDRSQQFGFKVINYKVSFAKTFDIDENDTMNNYGITIPKGLMKRELRGIIFDSTTGQLMSRPFNKFFNVGERSETRIHNIDLSQPHVITEKMDGSMIRPLSIDGKIRLATKMGLSEVAMEAEKIVTTDQLQWMEGMIQKGITPLFEFIAPNNRIVVEYDKSELVLLALRMNRTGDYLDIEEWSSKSGGSSVFRIVPHYGSLTTTTNNNNNKDSSSCSSSLKDYIERQRNATSREGDVLIVNNNERYKIKNDWYLRAHRIATPSNNNLDSRRILALILNNELDDVLPTLNEEKLQTVKKVELEFREAYQSKLARLQSLGEEAIREASNNDGNINRKDLVNFITSKRLSKIESRFIFGMADGGNINDLLLDYIKSGVDKQSRYKRVVGGFLGLNVS